MSNDAKPLVAVLREALQGNLFAAWVQHLHLEVRAATPGEVRLALPVAAQHVHAGGVLCGQSMMAAADTAMVLAVMSQLGEFRPMTTVQMQTSFLRPVPGTTGATAELVARVLRMGKTMVFGEIELSAPDGKLAAHTTTTYMLL
jgi:uncharacterized protein (TIGR00369 family)